MNRPSARPGRTGDNRDVAIESRMIFLGFGKFVRADKIYALEPITGSERGGGKRTLVWVEGIAEPVVASRTERTILHDMGQDAAAQAPLVDQAVDLGDLGRRARRLLESTTGTASELS